MPAPPQRGDEANDPLAYRRDAVVAPLASSGDDENLRGAFNLLLPNPRLRTSCRVRDRRQAFPKVEDVGGAKPDGVERFVKSHRAHAAIDCAPKRRA